MQLIWFYVPSMILQEVEAGAEKGHSLKASLFWEAFRNTDFISEIPLAADVRYRVSCYQEVFSDYNLVYSNGDFFI